MDEKLREELITRYNQAFETGDFDAVQEVLQASETDPLLAQMIRDADEPYETQYLADHPEATGVDADAIVREALARYDVETATGSELSSPRPAIFLDPPALPSNAIQAAQIASSSAAQSRSAPMPPPGASPFSFILGRDTPITALLRTSRLETPPCTLRSSLEAYARAEGLSWEALASELVCSIDALNQLAESAPPRSEQFAQDVTRIAGRAVDGRRLLMLLRRISVLEEWSRTAGSRTVDRGLLLAARSREPSADAIAESGDLQEESDLKQTDLKHSDLKQVDLEQGGGEEIPEARTEENEHEG